jgi:transglutaminase-like putative cysteine protease
MGRSVTSALLAWAILSGSALAAQAAAPGAAAPAAAAPAAPKSSPEATRTYKVEQKVTLNDIPAGTKLVRWWISIPDEDRNQDLLDLAVTSAPGKWRIEREGGNGGRFLYVEVPAPTAAALDATIVFTVRRRPVSVAVDPAKVGPITDQLLPLFAAELSRDAPHMAVTPEIQKIADTACGGEKNLALQARKLLDYVADSADHYSKDPSKPNCGIGDAAVCMEKGGGCCTDLHSLFIALARARGIPARLQMGYRMQEKNLGKTVDPGYRCWAEYFLPGYGWISADIVEADAKDGLGRDRWFTGLTERRLHLNAGREFVLEPKQAAPGKVNTMIMGYAELDGTPARVLPDGDKKPQLGRTILCVEVPEGDCAALGVMPKQ